MKPKEIRVTLRIYDENIIDILRHLSLPKRKTLIISALRDYASRLFVSQELLEAGWSGISLETKEDTISKFDSPNSTLRGKLEFGENANANMVVTAASDFKFEVDFSSYSSQE
jgi:hypothetical protein